MSRQPGDGATFIVCLPRCEQIPPAQAAACLPELLSGHGTVLSVEDDEDVRRVVGHVLRAQGYQILEASDGVQALQILHASPGPLHLVLTDVIMPRMTGLELVRRIKPLFPAAKVLYMSGYTDEILGPVTGQPLALIQRPFTARALIEKIREMRQRE